MKTPARRLRALALVATLLFAATSQAVEPWDRWPEPAKAPSLPTLRLELGHGPAWYRGQDAAVIHPGLALAAGAILPLSDALATGVRGVHARFGGTLETSHASSILVPLELHSGFADPRGFWFGLLAGGHTSPGDYCGGGVPAIGLMLGLRTRVQGPLGLSLSTTVLSGYGGGACGDYPLEPIRKESLGAGVHSVLQLTYDVGSR